MPVSTECAAALLSLRYPSLFVYFAVGSIKLLFGLFAFGFFAFHHFETKVTPFQYRLRIPSKKIMMQKHGQRTDRSQNVNAPRNRVELKTRPCKGVNATFTNNKNRHRYVERGNKQKSIAFKNLCNCTKISNINVNVGSRYYSNLPRLRPGNLSPLMRLANFSVNPCGKKPFLKCDRY